MLQLDFVTFFFYLCELFPPVAVLLKVSMYNFALNL